MRASRKHKPRAFDASVYSLRKDKMVREGGGEEP
jgi:hypothetical protein